MSIYQIIITLYILFMRLISPFHPKVKRMLNGQKETWDILRRKMDTTQKYVWFHAASLGEFEQGLPLMRRIKEEKPNDKILLTFFSPSGFEVCKDCLQADVIVYLPFDTKRNVQRFVQIIPLSLVIFIKYEFWMNYLSELKTKKIPTYLISAFFQNNQLFFRWYGKNYRKCLGYYTCLFVQDYHSKELLAKYGISHVSVCGDTRFDRVYSVYNQRKELPSIEKFLNRKGQVLIAGSTWKRDEKLIIPYFNRTDKIYLIIAPHETHENHLQSICSQIKRTFVLYSEATEEAMEKADCLIIDCFGLLSSLYRYGHMAYVGGGFGRGIHNILEAAVFGIPVLFGPNHQRFREAKNLINKGGGMAINHLDELSDKINQLLDNPELQERIGEKARQFVWENTGATEMIFQQINLN